MTQVIKPKSIAELDSHFATLIDQVANTRKPTPAMFELLRDNFATTGLPTNKHEDWRYTSLKKLPKARLDNQANQHNYRYDCQELPINTNNSEVAPIIVNALTAEVHTGKLPKGVTIAKKPLSELSDKTTEHYQEFYQRSREDVFFALNQMLATDFLSIQIANNMTLSSPILIDYGTDSKAQLASAETILKISQVVVELGTSSQATIVEIHRNAKQKELANTFCQFEVGQNAQCYHYSIQQEETLENHFFWNGSANVARDGQFNSSSLIAGNYFTRRFMYTRLAGEGATTSVNSAYSGKANQICDTRTYTHHLAAHCESEQMHRGLLNDSSIGVFNGLIYVDPVALKTDGQMDNNVILLSDKAQNNSKPQLEIYADDVKCSHGFTCGQLDQQQLFYMRSRGIEEQLARSYLLKAFFAKVLVNFPSFLNLKGDSIYSE